MGRRPSALLVALSTLTVLVAGRMQAPLSPKADSPGTRRGGGAGMAMALGGGAIAAGACAWGGVRLANRRNKRQPQEHDEHESGVADSDSVPVRAPEKSRETPSTAKAEETTDSSFALSPERLWAAASLNSNLEPLVDHLAAVPVFTVTVGGATSPLTVPGPDGQKLAYFFFEASDAAAFLRAVSEQAGDSLQAGVIGLRLSEVVRAYGTEAARNAKETFVLIPLMSEVAAARRLLQQREATLVKLGQPPAPTDPSKLSATNGLVPIFWSEALAVQTAAGKRRKILFFRESDLQAMWTNLTLTRQQAAAGEGAEAEAEAQALPSRPTVHASDLQTVCSAIVEANATDGFIFRASSMALHTVQRGATNASTPAATGAGAGGGGLAYAAPPPPEAEAGFDFQPEDEDEGYEDEA